MPSSHRPAELAGRVLFEPYRALLATLEGEGPPPLAILNALLCGVNPLPSSGRGVPIRFVAPDEASGPAYEAAIYRDGGVPTRSDNWHDFFNALVWCVFPLAKQAINRRHMQDMDVRPGAPRGRVRDALTQFDECGVVVTSDSAELLAELQEQRWEAVFWQCRAQLSARVRVTVFGHATLDQLRMPFVGLCGKTVYREVPSAWLAQDLQRQWADTDAWLARWLLLQGDLQPRHLRPLPLLGIPGVTADSERPEYYRDIRQFRPLRRPLAAGGV